MSAAQKAWIQNYMSEFEAALAGKDFKDPERGYAKYMDTDAFIDHFIINELFRNIDGISQQYIHVQRQWWQIDNGSRLGFSTYQWAIQVSIRVGKTDGWLIYTNPVPFWWDRLLQDKKTSHRKLAKRWKNTAEKIYLATSKLLDEIDRTAEFLSEAQKTEFPEMGACWGRGGFFWLGILQKWHRPINKKSNR